MSDGSIGTHDRGATASANRQETRLLAGIGEALAVRPLAEPVRARLTACHLGPVRFCELEASPHRWDRTPALIARDRYDGIGVQLALAGMTLGEAAGRPVVSAPGTVTLLDFGQPFTMADQSPRRIIDVAVPRSMLAARLDDVRLLHGRVLDVATAGLLAAMLQALPSRVALLPPAAAAALGGVLVDVLLLEIGHDPLRAPLAASDRRTTLLDRATRVVDSRLGSKDLTPDWLATRLNVSRSELYVAFEPAGGIARFIWRRRLEAARAALLDQGDMRRIGEIAFAFGFSSEAHFARAFRTAYGRTASDTRRARVPI